MSVSAVVILPIACIMMRTRSVRGQVLVSVRRMCIVPMMTEQQKRDVVVIAEVRYRVWEHPTVVV